MILLYNYFSNIHYEHHIIILSLKLLAVWLLFTSNQSVMAFFFGLSESEHFILPTVGGEYVENVYPTWVNMGNTMGLVNPRITTALQCYTILLRDFFLILLLD